MAKTPPKEEGTMNVEVLATVICEQRKECSRVWRFHEIENDVGITNVIGDPYLEKSVVGDFKKIKILICKP